MTAETFALLTRIRVPGASMDLRRAAGRQYLFPLVGLVVGLAAAVAAAFLSDLLGRSMALVTGGAVLVMLYYINGILHTEGLADFADGLMAKGPAERKRSAMKDVHCGAAGVFTMVLYVAVFYGLVTALCGQASSQIPTGLLPWSVSVVVGLAVAEMSGKLAMVTAMYMGPSAHPGMGSVFVEEASASKLLVAMALASLGAVVLSGLLFPVVLTGIAAGVWTVRRARSDLGGVSGDVFGAANELGRMVALFAWVLLI